MTDLIKRKKVKQIVYYSLNIDVWNTLIKWFYEIKQIRGGMHPHRKKSRY